MGQHQHDIELASMERLCRDLVAEEGALPLERAGRLKLAANYRNEATGFSDMPHLPRKPRNREAKPDYHAVFPT